MIDATPQKIIPLFKRRNAFWQILWGIVKFVYGGIALDFIVNVVANNITLVSIFFWITDHVAISTLIFVIFLLLSFYVWWQNYHTINGSSFFVSSDIDAQNRKYFLDNIHAQSQKILEQSGNPQIYLNLVYDNNAVANIIRLHYIQETSIEVNIPLNTPITDIFERSHENLLILGERGGGKTTLLLQLALLLQEQAALDSALPIPVVISLFSWDANRRASFQEWLLDEIAATYRVSRTVIGKWLQNHQILPMLDDLDRLSLSNISLCIDAINVYKREQLVNIVVCCQRQVYFTQEKRLALHDAVNIQSLTSQQIDESLQTPSNALDGLRVLLNGNREFYDVLSTPFMLHIAMRLWQDRIAQEKFYDNDIEALRRQITREYINQRIEDHFSGLPGVSPQHIHLWLAYLAQHLRNHRQTTFYVERLQPDWLPYLVLSRLYESVAGTGFGALIGIIVSLSVNAVAFGGDIPVNNILFISIGALLGGIIWNLNHYPRNALSLTKKILYIVRLSVINGFWLGIITSLAFSGWKVEKLRVSEPYGFLFAICGFFITTLILTGSFMDAPLSSNPDKRTTRRRNNILKPIQVNYIRLGIICGCLLGISFGISTGLTTGFNTGLSFGLEIGLSYLGIGILLGFLLLDKQSNVELVEVISWSPLIFWRFLIQGRHIRTSFLIFSLILLFYGLGVGLGTGFNFGWSVGLRAGIGYGLGAAISVSLTYWILFGLWGSILHEVLDDELRHTPNEGVKLSLRRAIFMGLFAGVASVLIGSFAEVIDYAFRIGITQNFNFDLHSIIDHGLHALLRDGVFIECFGVLLPALLIGGVAVLRHYFLRILLGLVGVLPFNLIRSLDDATHRGLLFKVGGGYRFSHSYIFDYFADGISGIDS